MKKKSINYFIAARTLPWVVIFLIFSGLVLFYLSKTIIDSQLEDHHNQIIEQFDKNINNTLSNLEEQVDNIANNELVINSLIDPEGREDYISLFIRSFSFTGVDDAYIGITDFSGSVVVDNNSTPIKALIEASEWKEIVLNKGDSYEAFNQHGLIIIKPIIFADYPEGAVVITISIESVNAILLNKGLDKFVGYVNPEGYLLYSSKKDHPQLAKIYSRDHLGDWFFLEKVLENGHTILSAEPNQSAYSKIYFIVVFMAVAILIAILCASLSIFLSSRLISTTLKKFLEAIHSQKFNEDENHSFIDNNDPYELVSIHTEFKELVVDLFETRLSRKNMQSILNSLNEYLVVFDIHGNTKMNNYAFERLLNSAFLDDDDDFKKIVPEEYRKDALNTTDFMKDFECSYKIISTDSAMLEDEECIVSWSRSLYYTEEGDLEGVIFIGTDITNSRAVEKDLHLKNLAIEEASNGIVIADALKEDMPLIYTNQAFIDMSGYSYSDIIGHNCRFLQGEQTDKHAIQRIRDAIKNKQRITEILLNYRKDGSVFYNHLMLTPITDKSNNVTHYLGVQLDVTDKVTADNELLHAKAKAEESAELKSQFLASMSHEIRTPMNGVLGMLGLLQRTKLDNQQEHYAELAHTSAESLLTLINDILDFSKVEAGKMELEIIDFNLPAMLGDFTEAMAQRAEEKQLELILDLSKIKSSMVKGDPGRIRQVLTNLLGNALKFTAQGEIVIRAELSPSSMGGLRFDCSVKDTGMGIPAEKVDTLFDSFSQVDASTTRKYGGTGLGLAIVKQLCELMGGDITVSSEIEQGSTFSFFIELSPSEQDFEVLPKVNIKEKNILIVDDNETSRQVLNTQLSLWGATVVEATSGEHALTLLTSEKEKRFSIAFIDMQIEGMCSETLAQTIRSNESLDYLHLVMMTPLSCRGDAKRFAKLGFSAFFPKPVTLNDLFSALDVLNNQNTRLKKASPLLTKDNLRSLEYAESQKATTVVQQHYRLLLVEDNIINQEVALGILKALGYSADIAANGLEALAALKTCPADAPYDLIFMDCQMPEMDGYEATESIRSSKAGYSAIPIIAMTANAMKGDKEKCLSIGMSDYISKPIEPDNLRGLLQKWLGSQLSDETEKKVEESNMTTSDDTVWDEDGFMKRIMNNETIANKLIDLFKTDTPKTISELEEAISHEKAEEAGLLAHKLKGSVGNLGGIELAELAHKIESAGKGQNLDEVKALWPMIKPNYEKLLNKIESRQ
ncbi:MAG: response regulator [Cellvibrionaceae bacterium]